MMSVTKTVDKDGCVVFTKNELLRYGFVEGDSVEFRLVKVIKKADTHG